VQKVGEAACLSQVKNSTHLLVAHEIAAPAFVSNCPSDSPVLAIHWIAEEETAPFSPTVAVLPARSMANVSHMKWNFACHIHYENIFWSYLMIALNPEVLQRSCKGKGKPKGKVQQR